MSFPRHKFMSLVIYKNFFFKRITWFTAQSVLNPYTNDSGIKNVEDFDFYKYLTKTKYHIHIVIRVYDMYMPLCIIHKYKCLKTNELCYLLTAKTIYHLLYKLFQGFFGVFLSRTNGIFYLKHKHEFCVLGWICV